MEVAGERVRTVTIDGASHLVAATLDDGPETPEERKAFEVSVHALPGFDEYVLGYEDRSAVLAPAHQDRIVPGGNGIFLPMIVAGGRVVGTWTKQTRARRVTYAAAPFTRLTRSQAKGFADAVGRHARFLGIEASVA